MTKRGLLFIGTMITLLVISGFTLVNSNGAQIGYTLSPPDGPGDCSICHGGGATIPTVSVTATPAFGTGNTYVTGTTYTVAVNVTGYVRFGFDLEMINGTAASSGDAGTIGPAVSNCHITAPSSFPTVTNVSHNAPIPSTSSATFKWTAPASGNVYVWIVGLGVNFDGTNSGDRVKDYNFMLSPLGSGIIERNENPFNLNVFPNPTSDKLHLSYSLMQRGSVNIQVFDLNGKVAMNLLTETQDAGEHSFDSSISSLPKGIYTVQVNLDGLKSVKKLLVQ
jgi:hypothetical protein